MRAPSYLTDLLGRLPERLHGDLLFLHLGHFDDRDDFRLAQRRLNSQVLARGDIADGLAVIDVGCGIGGTLAAIDAAHVGMKLVGVNVGADQLAVAERSVAPRAENQLAWVQADACALPFAPATFDRVICIEAMFHFASRGRFFSEAARVLRPAGRIAGSDIRIRPHADPALVALVTEGLGPWPDPLGDEGDLAVLAEGFALEMEDVTAAVGPSFVRLMGPEKIGAPASCDNGGDRGTAALGALFARGELEILYFWGQLNA